MKENTYILVVNYIVSPIAFIGGLLVIITYIKV